MFQAVMYTTYCYLFHVRHAIWPTITGWVLCHEKSRATIVEGLYKLRPLHLVNS